MGQGLKVLAGVCRRVCPEDCLWLSQTFTKEESSEVGRVDKKADKNEEKDEPENLLWEIRAEIPKIMSLLETGCLTEAMTKIRQVKWKLDRHFAAAVMAEMVEQ